MEYGRASYVLSRNGLKANGPCRSFGETGGTEKFPTLLEIHEDEYRRLYEAGHSQKEIADITGMIDSTVALHLKLLNLDISDRDKRRKMDSLKASGII